MKYSNSLSNEPLTPIKDMDWKGYEATRKRSIKMLSVFYKEFGMMFISFSSLHVNELKN